MELIHPLVQSYAECYSSAPDPFLREVAEATGSHPHAHMFCGHHQGKFLEIFSMLLQPEKILEIGTFTGYSALCLAKGLRPHGRLHTIELRENDAITAASNFNHSNYKDRIILHIGNALTIIPELDETWDLVFMDADKTGYLDYYHLVLPKLRNGGVIIADNVLFHGQVLDPAVTSKSAKAVQEFNVFIQQDERVENVMITLRDGLMLIRKK